MRFVSYYPLVLCIALISLDVQRLSAQTASVDLGATDTVSGLVNTHNADGTDGENGAFTCGPSSDERDGRIALGLADDDLPDHFLYFRVTDGTVAASSTLTITATLHNASALQDHVAYLEYTNDRATGSADLRDVFFLHPFHYALSGIDDWVDLTWILRDAGFTGLQRSTADFRLVVRRPDGQMSRGCFDTVSVSVGAAAALSCPSSLSASTDDELGQVLLSWTNGETYDRILILRNGLMVASLPGNATSHTDTPAPGRYRYQIVALKNGDSCFATRLQSEVRLFPDVTRCGCPNPDANGDGEIDLQDLAIVASNQNLSPGHPDFHHRGRRHS